MKKLIFFIIPLLLVPSLVLADCTEFVKHNDKDNPTSWDAHAYAEIDLSNVYGEDCTDNPYKNYAKVRVNCDGDTQAGDGPLYVYRLDQDADWDDAHEEINCGEYGCSGEDKDYSAGTHTITLRDEKGDMDSVFFVCYDYDEGNDGSWAVAWTGWAYWGDRKVFKPRVEKKCHNDVYWYDSLGRRGDKYDECGSSSCGNWEPNYCKNNEVKHKRTCYDRGCEDSACYQRRNTETEIVKTCDGRKTGERYCSGNSIVKDVEVQECSSGGCEWINSVEVETVKSCSLECIDATCAKDEDGDGFYDRNDNCPSQGSVGYGIDSVGCPHHDSDNDGVIDEGDNCSEEAGSGSDGCPNFIEKFIHLFGFEGWTM